MQARYYSATAVPTALTGNITNANTVINVAAATGFPASTPFIIAVDYGTPSEEVCLVTSVAGLAFTVVRGYDGTSATAHNVGAPVRHTWTAMDGNDSRFHEGSSQGVHGIGGTSSVVGTLDTQTLTNKTLTSPIINGSVNIVSPNITGTVTGGASYTGITATSPVISGTVTGGASYTAPTITGNVPGNPTFTAGLAAGSTGQLAVNASGRISSTTQTTGFGETASASPVLTNTSYAATTPTIQVTAIAPPSGKLLVQGSVRIEANVNHFTSSSIRVSGSTSGVIRAAGAGVPHVVGTTNTYIQETGHLSFVVTSANPGETITAEWFHQTDSAGGNYTVYAKNITVTPLIG